MTTLCDHHGVLSASRCNRCGESVGGTGEASGLIDVRALATLLGTGPRRDLDPPRFNPLTAAPVMLAPTPVPARGSVAPAQKPLYVMLGVLALGMMALATMIVAPPAPDPAPANGAALPVLAQALAPIEEPDEVTPEVVRAEAVEVPAPALVEAPVATQPATGKNSRKQPKKPQESVSAPPVAKPITPAPATEPAQDSVSCLIEPDKCKRKPAAAPVVESQPAPSTSLPEKLELGDISEGTRATKAAATDRCKALARGGEKVTIKLSISGPQGTVLSATAQDDAGNPQLAACCATELSRSTFKQVQKAQIGATATLKF